MMVSRNISILATVGVFILAVGVWCEEDQTTEPWRKLPKLYDYDDFDDCRRANPEYEYCVVKAHLEENTKSALWRQISRYSADPRHYRRDVLELGICVDRCNAIIDRPPENDTRTNRASSCSTERVWLNYALNSTSHVSNCVSAETADFPPVGLPEILFGALFGILLALVISTTIIDVKYLTGKDALLVKAFSLSTNLSKLGALSSRSRQDLLFLDGARVVTMMVILLCHATIPMIRFPLKNPEILEQQFVSWWFPIALAGNTYTVQIFFIIGGVVLAVNFMDHIKAHAKFNLSYLWSKIINRLIRILPVYAIVIFFQASWYQRMSDGPIAYRYKDYCRDNWWTNMLFVNNYINPNEPCAQFTWYLGADFQLFLAGSTIMMVIWKFPKITQSIIYTMIAFAFVVPAVIIYVYNLDATVLVLSRYIANEIRELGYYINIYVTFESNAGNYFFGMIMGLVYHKLVESGKKIESSQSFKAMFFLAAFFFVAMNAMTVMLPREQLEEPYLLTAVFGSLLKSSWGILFTFLLLFLSFRPECLFASFLQHPIMLVAAKISYCVYVVQYTVIYLIYRNVTTPLMHNAFNMIFFTSVVLFITLLTGLLLHVCVEVPFMTLFKELLEPKLPHPISTVSKKRADCQSTDKTMEHQIIR
ncbi:regulator of hypoxia-inducible factor 1-like [Topomyia yanbarensis]|uniref:regulator of hypoxia-inducible factor 1-like n=1 Tax=Topomyia yanbarensis TaxID=2498891 RepID=UPI00273AEAEA|nr:regulator of hypoxia-inducible factor 1-like [Topomyia yanbarensis]